jgi:nitrite reductase (NADH) small subunit
MSLALLEPFDAGSYNGRGRIEIRFSNFEVNDVAALAFQLIGPRKRFKRRLALDSGHPFGNLTFQFSFHIWFYVKLKIKAHQYIIGDVTDSEPQDWVRVAGISEIPTEGIGLAVKAEGLGIAIFRWNDRLYAIEDLCPHLGFPLSEGMMLSGVVVCGWHGWRVRLEDGACGREPSCTKVFPCEVRNGEVYVRIFGVPDSATS